MKAVLTGCVVTVAATVCLSSQAARADVIAGPYVQNPSQHAMTVCWFTRSDAPGRLTVTGPDGSALEALMSTPVLKRELEYSPKEIAHMPGGIAPDPPYLHRIRVEGLQSGTTYGYTVEQADQTFSQEFRTAPEATAPVRFIVYADSETEPESTSKYAEWPALIGGDKRVYPVDQTEGYRQNLRVMQERQPGFVAIAGDLVETGGEQRDWDEFWRHNAGELGDIAGSVPILPAVGNHENYAGSDGGYSVEGAKRGVAKYRAYFETPDNGSGKAAFEDRFYRIDYGPLTWITIDTSDGSADKSASDTNFFLLGERDGGEAPDFNPGSTQYAWLEEQLADAQANSRFTFVQFHHAPYSVGPHGFPAGPSRGQDTQSGQPVRVLSPLFEKYGVDAVFCGHDEMYEHSLVGGIHYFDVGIGGDGLRKPSNGAGSSTEFPSANPYQVFLAHVDAPEFWDGRRLISGGKHYGHLEVNVSAGADGVWTAELTPVYVFPVMNAAGEIVDWERREYEDQTLLRR